MDWDDIRHPPKRPAVLGEDLSNFAISELEARIQDLQAEIDRVEAELKSKRAHESAAARLFKS